MAASPSNSVTPVHLHSLVTVKLTKDNYRLWKTQIVPYLRGQRLFGFVDGSLPCPSPTIPNPDATTNPNAPPEVPNPNYNSWYDQDQVVLSALVSSLSEAYLLGGLDTSYDAIVTSISTQIDKMSSEAIFNHLLAFELRIEQQQSALDTSVGSVNVATRHDNRPRGGKYPQQQRNSQPQQPHGSYSNYRGRGRGNRGKGGQSPHHPSNPRPVCQVCGKIGHTTIQCYYRFDHAYQGTPPNMAAYLTSPSSPPDANCTLHRGFKCLDMSNGKVFISRHVIFDEKCFPFANPNTNPPTSQSMPSPQIALPFPLFKNNSSPTPSITSPSQHHFSHNSTPINQPTPSPLHSPESSSSSNSASHPLSFPTSDPSPISPTPHDHTSPTLPSMDHADVAALPGLRSHHMITRSHNNIVKPKHFTDGTVRYPLPQAFFAAVSARFSFLRNKLNVYPSTMSLQGRIKEINCNYNDSKDSAQTAP
ncbi:hypothetical protein F0562_004253 [Nyssa sinensis]|uniref:Uncharacterized protein n=1 Tax=Nyssa sinensis TaxID=561372 RepID=A0A5J5BYU6_9ASTE|nr:hypothetical protein F0562_004253 [Nyssa sinensis]